jgi:hypothetical protein
MPKDCVFSHKGPGAFPVIEDRVDTLSLCAIVNSKAFRYCVEAQLARTELAQSFEVGLIQQTPIPHVSDRVRIRLADYAQASWQAARSLSAENEMSNYFVLHAPVRKARADQAAATEDIDDLLFEMYQIDGRARLEIEAWAASRSYSGGQSEEDDEDIQEGDQRASAASWSVGVSFARFDIRLATGERPIPTEPDPFDPLPAKSPGMLPDGDAPFMPTSGVFVDDPGHADDLAARVTTVYERVGETPPAPDELRRTLAKDFFPAHIRMYSKSRRKAPIYWQLATPSASYSVWLYIHAFGKDTLFRVQNDYIAPKLAHERRELEGLLAEAGPSPTTAQSRAIEAQSAFVEELSALLDEVKRVAPLWDPDLDDGVILNFAPLWRLVPQNRAWQKELRAAWASLVDGDYDWAYLSMRLWPERVVHKCAKDRSLAIAHDLEDVFWLEDAAGKWQPRQTPTRSLDDLIAERTSPAVKAALQSLLDAPDPVAASGRGRRKKS